MRFLPTAVDGAYVIEIDVHSDERGAFARTFCEDEFRAAGIDFRPVQMNISRNRHRHTLRGMHYHPAPHEEPKLVQCVRGRIFDAAVDLRPGSPTYLKTAHVELDAEGDRLFYIPPGCAHGFLTLADRSDVLYGMGIAYVPGVALGQRWDDPAFDIPWPARPAVISERDASYALLRAATLG
jgi:dTDP-4-dehydrorhamnose 3,5-epimerase